MNLDVKYCRVEVKDQTINQSNQFDLIEYNVFVSDLTHGCLEFRRSCIFLNQECAHITSFFIRAFPHTFTKNFLKELAIAVEIV